MDDMKKYTIDVEGKEDYKKLLAQLEKRKNTELLSHGEYYYMGSTGYYQIVILTDNVGRLPESKFVYGMVNEQGDLL